MHMSKAERQSELRAKTQQLLQGPLKHIRVVGLAAALLPVAAVPAAAAPDQHCSSAGNLCGFVWADDGDGIQEAGEPGIEGAVVTVGETVTFTDSNGFYEIFVVPGSTYTVQVQIPNDGVPTLTNVGDDTTDSDGELIGSDSVATVFFPEGVTEVTNTDFGFAVAPTAAIGAGTPGYWMNHPEAWPVASIVIGGDTYSRETAIQLLKAPGNKDKTYTMFASLVSAKLNLLIGTNPVCITGEVDAADAWMDTYGPVGTKVAASSYAWKVGEPHHRAMDNYNNGMLCAPHRD
jgi:hypothetical protein